MPWKWLIIRIAGVGLIVLGAALAARAQDPAAAPPPPPVPMPRPLPNPVSTAVRVLRPDDRRRPAADAVPGPGRPGPARDSVARTRRGNSGRTGAGRRHTGRRPELPGAGRGHRPRGDEPDTGDHGHDPARRPPALHARPALALSGTPAPDRETGGGTGRPGRAREADPASAVEAPVRTLRASRPRLELRGHPASDRHRRPAPLDDGSRPALIASRPSLSPSFTEPGAHSRASHQWMLRPSSHRGRPSARRSDTEAADRAGHGRRAGVLQLMRCRILPRASRRDARSRRLRAGPSRSALITRRRPSRSRS